MINARHRTASKGAAANSGQQRCTARSQSPRPLTLAGIVVTQRRADGAVRHRFTGEEVARILNVALKYPNVNAATDGGDVNLRLRGLANLKSVCASADHGEVTNSSPAGLRFPGEACGSLPSRAGP